MCPSWCEHLLLLTPPPNSQPRMWDKCAGGQAENAAPQLHDVPSVSGGVCTGATDEGPADGGDDRGLLGTGYVHGFGAR
eukprot:5653286-Prymnesium_polylepis.1